MIKRRSNGMWRLDVKSANGTRVRKSLNTTDKAEALLRAPTALQEVIDAQSGKKPQSSTPAKPPKALTITLRDAFKRARREYPKWRDSKSPRTIEDNFELVCQSDLFNDSDDLTTVTYKKCADYVDQLEASGTSASTINQRLSLLSVLITCGARLWGFEVTPFKMPRKKVTQGRIRVLSREEEASVIEWFHSGTLKYHDDMVDYVAALVDTGCRQSEMLSLEPRDVNWEANTLTIWFNKADLPRTIPMTERLRTILKRRADRNKGKFFGRLTVDSADNCWEWVREKMELEHDEEFVIHALRHTTASRLAAAGMDAFRIQKWMGHKSITTTMIYVTLFANDLQDLAGALEKGSLRPREAVRSVL